MSVKSSDPTPTSSGTSTPAPHGLSSWNVPATFSHAITGLIRRISSETSKQTDTSSPMQSPASFTGARSLPSNKMDGVYTPPYRNASPFQPPPLYPIILKGYKSGTTSSAQLLSRALAEEIRLLVPARLQLCEEWNLVYSLEQDGVSLGTLYKKCNDLRRLRNGYVLVVKDGEGGVSLGTHDNDCSVDRSKLFGAYLTDVPHPAPHYFGTGECFLWRASILSTNSSQNLPPPPSSDTTSMQRSTTIGSSSSLSPSSLEPPTPITSKSPSGASSPERIRFKAFPYSGVNDYVVFCETGFLSVGGGDGHYGLWLDDNFEKGVSNTCPTFGNEPLSDEGTKFDILGVELWSIGNS